MELKRILVTGATGYLGYHVVLELLKLDEYLIYAVGGRPEDKANPLPEHPRLKVFPLDALFSEKWENIDTVINCAFARSNDPKLLADAIDFTVKEIRVFEDVKVRSVINISSQGVYKRLSVGELSTEDSPVEPIDLYSMAKYASEKMFRLSNIPYVTNVRLASILMPQRFLYSFVNKAKIGEHFTVTAPNQYAALLDVTDAAGGLAAMVNVAPGFRADIYNLGIGTQYSLLEYAEKVKSIGESLGYIVGFDVVDNGSVVCAGMDCTRIMHDCSWQPAISTERMIRNIFERI